MKKIYSLIAMTGIAVNVAATDLVTAPKPSFEQQDDYIANTGVKGKQMKPILADFDNNGLTDIYFGGEVYTDTYADGAYVGFNQGSSWNTIESLDGSYPIIYRAKARTYMDINQDGYVDFIALDSRTNGWGVHNTLGYSQYCIIKNNGDGTFTDVTTIDNNMWNSDDNSEAPHSAIATADVNGDGYPDFLVQGELIWGGSISWDRATRLFINNGDGTFTTKYPLYDHTIAGASGGSVAFGDFNCDGYPDIVVSGYHQGSHDDISSPYNQDNIFHLYKNDGKGNFTYANDDVDAVKGDNWLNNNFKHSGGDLIMKILDYNQDGKQDIIMMGYFDYNSSIESATGAGRETIVLLNTSTDGNTFAFDVLESNMWASSGMNKTMASFADFNGDGYLDYLGFGAPSPAEETESNTTPWDWTTRIFTSYSKGSFDSFNYVSDIIGNTSGEEAHMTVGDINGDGMLDVISHNDSNNNYPRYWANTTLNGTDATIQVADEPTNVTATYDADNKRLTITWDKMTTPSGSKAIYNTYIIKDGKTFMRCPANKETGKLTAYSDWSEYLPDETAIFDNIEPGTYEVGVQSVSYSYNASPFTVSQFEVKDVSDVEIIEAETANVNVYNMMGVCLKQGVDRECALDNLPAGIYIVGNKKVIKK